MRNFIKTQHIIVVLSLIVVLIFQQSGLSNYVKAVDVSNDLSNFITDVEIVNKDGTASSKDENENLILQKGATYQVKDGKLIIVIDKNNENYQRLTNASNVNLNVDIFASLASGANTDKMEWSANKKRT